MTGENTKYIMKKKNSKSRPETQASDFDNNFSVKRVNIKSFCAWEGDVLVLNVLGTPSAKQDGIGKPKGNQLKISVTATPIAGRATDHMVKFLAGIFGVTTKDITVVFGRMNVNKQLRIHSPKNLPAVISKQLS
jgi:uncharacterized protein (TIGR00251 family)